jgi:hypothetical protein
MFPISAHNLTAATPGNAGLVRRKFVSTPLRMRSFSAFAGDLTLTIGRHRGEATALFGVGVVLRRHVSMSPSFPWGDMGTQRLAHKGLARSV